MPTGGGKSVTFQVPALARPGICLVITPLIALMKDQVQGLRRRGIKAAAIYSGLTHEEILVTLENCIFGDYKFLYISPERISSPLFQTKLRHMQVSFITVDEAHCISQWGYDFRPSYTRIADLRTLVPHAPILALTATATPQVVDDICRQLQFRPGSRTFRMSFERENLAYVVRHTEDKQGELIHILKSLPGSAVVYTRSRKGTRETAALLQTEGITATYYHAGLNNVEKDERQAAWLKGDIRVMVATNAFGMGIDKPDVRLVLHLDLPDSPEAYFQEAGRAGRDGRAAYAVLLYHKSDRTKLLRRVPDTYPDKDFIRQIYEHLCYYYQLAMGDGFHVTHEFDLDEFCRRFRHFPVPVDSALKILSRAGYIDYTEEQDNASRLLFLFSRDALYRLHDQPEEYERVIQTLLRTYGGLFSDYLYINEAAVAKLTNLTPERVYEILTSLDRRKIVHYIPHKRTPYITFLCRRVETERVVLTPAVYEERKANYEARIKAIIDYASGADTCRGQSLLHYFGETDAPRCGRCDVCLAPHQSGLSQGEFENIRTAILAQLAEAGTPVPPENLHLEGHNPDRVRTALHYLLQEEALHLSPQGLTLTT